MPLLSDQEPTAAPPTPAAQRCVADLLLADRAADHLIAEPHVLPEAAGHVALEQRALLTHARPDLHGRELGVELALEDRQNDRRDGCDTTSRQTDARDLLERVDRAEQIPRRGHVEDHGAARPDLLAEVDLPADEGGLAQIAPLDRHRALQQVETPSLLSDLLLALLLCVSRRLAERLADLWREVLELLRGIADLLGDLLRRLARLVELRRREPDQDRVGH